MQQRFAFRAEAVDTRSYHRLHGFRNSDFSDFTGEFVAGGTDAERPAFHESSDGLLDEQRRSFGARDDECAQLRVFPGVTQQGPNEFVGSVGSERIKMDFR